MKAAQYTAYDKKNSHLTLVDAPTPEPAVHQVLVKVSAAGVNHLDVMIPHGDVQMLAPYSMPQTAGNEMVGTIEKLGASVTDFHVGERVFARLPLDSIGAFAQYVAVDTSALARVPEYLSDEEAAAVPLTALTAMQAFDVMGIREGQTGKRIFISGGTGSVGAMAIPLAKAYGLTVITSGNATQEERVRALGADQFLDYKTQDYTAILKDVDYVLDTVGGDDTDKQMSILKRGGHIVSLRKMPNGETAQRMGLPAWKRILLKLVGSMQDNKAKKYGATYHFIFVHSDGAQLQKAADILTEKQIKPAVGVTYPLEKVNDALDAVEKGGSRGKTVVTFA